MKKKLALIVLTLVLMAPAISLAQVQLGGSQNYDIDYLTPKEYEIGGITFVGAENLDTRMVLLVAGIHVGDMVKIPGDRITSAIENLWQQGMFEDIKISVTKIQSNKVFLEIALLTRPKLSTFSFEGSRGIRKNEVDKLRQEMDIKTGEVVTENLLSNCRSKIRSYYIQKGYTNVEVFPTTRPDTTGGRTDRVIVNLKVNVGKKVKIDSLIFEGNTQIPTKTLQKKMKKTHDVHYAKHMYVFTSGFWKQSKYNEADLAEDLSGLIDYYNELGYRDARIIMDTMWPVDASQTTMSAKQKASQDRVKVKVKVHEGRPFYFRNITFSGNTIYTSEKLARHLRIEKGDPYNKTTLETNLNYNPSGTDVSSMYVDNGYLFFNATPTEICVENDSIDIEIRIEEGKQARIKNVTIEGNTVTNDKIIMRELHTRPGDLFSRDALLRSRRELITLGYFKEEKVIPEPIPNPKDGTVDIVYKVEEGSTSQLQLSGGFSSNMIIGQVGIQLNNFSARNIFNSSAWQPLPAGDGQKLGINAVSNGTHYYAISGSFTEPWLGGKNAQSLSVTIYKNRYSNGWFYKKGTSQFYSLDIAGGGISLGKRLKWPDDYFILSQGLTYKHYSLVNYPHLGNLFTDGHSNEISYAITLGRNSLDSPIYPRSGSEISVAGSITPPYSLLNGKDYSTADMQEKYKWIEYYKLNLRGSWMLNLVGDVVLNARFRFGFMGCYNNDIGLAPFGRYYVGGSGLNTWMLDGREVVPMRGYNDNSINPSNGGGVFDRFTMELRQPIIESASATIFVLGFLEGGNAWNNIKEFQPFKLYNSAGLGVRLYMPMFGLIGIDWGYGFDGINGGSQFHFSIGQSID